MNDNRPVIRIETDSDHYLIADQVTELLLAAGKRIFRRNRHLVFTYDLKTFNGTVYAQVDRLKIVRLQFFMADVARFERWGDRAGCYQPVDPPSRIASIIIRNLNAFPEYSEGGAA